MQKTSKYLLVVCAGVVIAGTILHFRNPSSSRNEIKGADAQRSATQVDASQAKTAAASRSAGYSKADDLDDYIRELSASNAAPREVELVQVKAWNECGAMKFVPDLYDKQIANINNGNMVGYKLAHYRKAAMERSNRRCKAFAMTTKLNQTDVGNLLQKSAAAGNIEAIARTLAMGINAMPPDQAKDAAVTAIASGDPGAIYEMAISFGPNGPFATTEGGEIGTISSEIAWWLVACDRGMDCSSTSWFVDMACINLGTCGPGDYRTNVQYSNFPPDTYQQALQIEARINAAISDGTAQKYFIHR